MAVLARSLAQAEVGAGTRLCLGLSGGLDSTALLHALCLLRPSFGFVLEAAHVDHRLQAASAAWADHCRVLAARQQVPLHLLQVTVPDQGSLEACARAARYAALAGVPCDRLLLAHQRDDQAESVLLALLRGSGPAGLAAMGEAQAPVAHPLGRYLLRPWLGLDRSVLRAWALALGLQWIEDPSNDDLRLDRNFLRHAVGPLLAGRFPGWRAALARTAHWSAEAQRLLDELAALDLARLASPPPPGADWPAVAQVAATQRDPARLAPRPDPARLPGTLAGWLALPGHRGRNLLRWLVAGRGLVPPPARRLEEWWRQLGAPADRLPELAWNGMVLRRWGGSLWLEPVLPAPAFPPDLWWQPERDGELEIGGGGRLAWWREPLATDAPSCPTGSPSVAPAGLLLTVSRPLRVTACHHRDGLRLVPGGPTRELRKLFQERGIPPWRRTRMPALRDGNRLVAVPGLAVASDQPADPRSPAWRILWQDAGVGRDARKAW